MKNISKIINFIIFLFIIGINIEFLNADCVLDKETAKKAAIQIYQFYEEGINIGFEVFNLNENMILDIYNDAEDKINTYDKSYFDGDIFIIEKKFDENNEINFRIDIKSNNCGNEIINTLNVNQPKLNIYAFSDECQKGAGKSNMCNLYEDTTGVSNEEFMSQMEKDIRNYEIINSYPRKVMNFIKKYFIFAFLPILLISILFMIRIIIFKKNYKKIFGSIR